MSLGKELYLIDTQLVEKKELYKSLKDDVYKLGQSDPERLLKYVSKTHS